MSDCVLLLKRSRASETRYTRKLMTFNHSKRKKANTFIEYCNEHLKSAKIACLVQIAWSAWIYCKWWILLFNNTFMRLVVETVICERHFYVLRKKTLSTWKMLKIENLPSNDLREWPQKRGWHVNFPILKTPLQFCIINYKIGARSTGASYDSVVCLCAWCRKTFSTLKCTEL